ncbi:MAG: pyridoxine 5'-phosphate synthase [Gammaproteobacteria bacterium]|nr:pyridoxine 5'-phosphate synthase [Gammaproteobacteria bacterium]MXY57949.1 pyridoxine 5'-phosphate synthase [Gammaproteobacteria bacterium]MYF28572.1 pyridoxine 5'-phosphate synthase [Gammaproteobacteria bacterium]MYK46681.1 pyridoxine 5'-phosphate synthase [Gammaproteobacteria bacterium]
MTALSVNVNKIAWLRNARGGDRPSVVDCARTILDAGAAGITVHPRPDARHIRADDVYALKEVLEEYPDREFNIEGNPTAPAREGYPGFDQLIETVRPDQCTLVPDDDGQLTSDHGWNLANPMTVAQLEQLVSRYGSWGARVSLFMDPVPVHIGAAKRLGADRIELYTGPYADIVAERGVDHPEAGDSWRTYRDAARYANERGLGVNAGHDLDLVNLARFVSMGGIAEVSIGHALIADALESGLAPTVRRYLEELES